MAYLVRITKKHKHPNHKDKKGDQKPNYVPPRIIEVERGNYQDFEEFILHNKSTIGLVIGARGSGKTATGMRIMENIFSLSDNSNKKKCYAMGFPHGSLPKWIKVADNIDEIGDNSFVLIDEGGVLFSSRTSMKSANKILSDLLLVARHLDISILFITQNSSNIDINVIRQLDYIILKKSSLLQLDFERKKIKELYNKISDKFEKYKQYKGLAYIYSSKFCGFVDFSLPSFWSSKISKSFRYLIKKKKQKKNK